MKLRSVLFLLSVLLLIISIIVVLLVLQMVVVPHIQQQAHIATVCKVTDILSNGPVPCITVTVTFLDLNGEVKNGYLKAREDEGQETLSTHPQCFCEDCFDPVFTSPTMHRTLLHHGNYLHVGQTTSCFFKTAEALRIRKLPALAMHGGSYSTHVTMHAILWPTMAFVVGFVATFFSLIYVCRDWDMDFSDMDFCIYVTGVVDA